MTSRLYDLLIGENVERKGVTKDMYIDDYLPVFVAAPMVRYSKQVFFQFLIQFKIMGIYAYL